MHNQKIRGKQISYETIINHNPENAMKDIISINGMTYHYNGETTVKANKTCP